MSLFGPAIQRVQTETEAFWYLNLTSEQQSAYDRLLGHLKEAGALHKGHDDCYTLLRFLKARQWDVQRAATMYQNMVKWRTDQRTDHLYETFTFPEREQVLRHYPHFYHKIDKYGRPVYIELLGQTDPAKILEATTLDRLMHYHICDWENLMRRVLPACSVLAGRPIITKSVILDFKGMSMKTFGTAAQKILKTVAAIDQDYYCESLGQMFIINTPTVFRLIWAVVNPLLEERTRRKIVILGSDYLPTVSQLIPVESLPTCLGGLSEVPASLDSVGPWLGVQLPSPTAATATSPSTQPSAASDAAGPPPAAGAGAAAGKHHLAVAKTHSKSTTVNGTAANGHEPRTSGGSDGDCDDDEDDGSDEDAPPPQQPEVVVLPQVTVKAVAVTTTNATNTIKGPALHQSATAPGCLHLEDRES